jgi:hypothetical protein
MENKTNIRASLLRAYKNNKWISLKRHYSGCYFATINKNVFRVETQDNRLEEGDQWVITTVSGDLHDEMDPYITHRFSLQDAQIWLVTAFHE